MASYIQGRNQAVWDVPGIPVWAPKLWHPKNNFQVFFFQFYFIKKSVDVAISEFKKHVTVY